MNQAVEIRTASASYDDVLQHLLVCDKNYLPKLSSKVDIPSYARKIVENAETFEAWSHCNLIGLIAVYFDDHNSGYITNVSTTEAFSGMGVANSLMQHCIRYASTKGSCEITLEVSRHNTKALNLYNKFGFKEFSHDNSTAVMKLKFKR